MTTLIQFNYSYFNYIITVINAKLTILEVEKLKETFYKLFEALNETSTKEEDLYYAFIINFYNKLNF